MSPRRTRRGVIKQDSSSPDTSKKGKKVAASPKEKSRSPPKRRTTRAGKTKITSDSEENRSTKVSKKSSRKKPVKSESDSLITDDESASESPKNSARLRSSLISEDGSTPRSQTTSSLSRVNTTPKSSPIAVTLSPHRSKKTPRRSPDNFGSPKTHTDTPLKLHKTPRKLVIKDSPSSSDESKPEVESRAASRSPSSRSKPKTPSPKKSPSKKTPSPKNSPIAKKSAQRITRKSTVPASSKKENSPRLNQTVSIVLKKVSPRLSRHSLPASKIRKSLKQHSSPSSKVAVVVLEKLNSSHKSESSPKLTPPLNLGKLSPKRAKSTGKKRPVSTNTGTPMRSIIPSSGNQITTVEKVIFELPTEAVSSSTRLSRKDLKNVSTPRRSLNLTESIKDSRSLLRKKSSTPKDKNRNFSAIDNESEPELSDTSLINMSDVFESDVSQKEDKDDDEGKDGTYEVDEPKTPRLLAKKATKRSSPDATLKRNETENKKVRFAESEITETNTAKLRKGTPGNRASLKRTSETRSKSRSPQRVSKSLGDSLRRRSSSVSVVEGTPRTPANKKTFNSIAKSDHKSQLASVNRLSRPRVSVASEKKAETKTPIARKIPNFAEIHKKTFEKMESLIDAKKRVADRHVVAMVNPIFSASKSMPEGAVGKRPEYSSVSSTSRLNNAAYNRFGFKVRKNEAVDTMSKKPASMTSEKKINARREILKGVRTNRRFELQMKSRKSK